MHMHTHMNTDNTHTHTYAYTYTLHVANQPSPLHITYHKQLKGHVERQH